MASPWTMASRDAALLLSADRFARAGAVRAKPTHSAGQHVPTAHNVEDASGATPPGAPPAQLYMYSCTPGGGSKVVCVTPLASRSISKLVASEDKFYALDSEGKLHCIADAMRPVVTLPFRQRVADVACGPAHVIVITETNARRTVLGFGNNRQGQLGFSDTRSQATPRPIPYIGKGVPHRVFAGAVHTACLITNGPLLLYGGKASPHEQKQPVRINMDQSVELCQVALGEDHVAAITSTGALLLRGHHHADDPYRPTFERCFDALWGSTCRQVRKQVRAR